MKFSGHFRDLIPMGFKFHKLYARNYKVYEKEDLWIWVARREIQYRHFNGKAADLIVGMILNDTYPLYTQPVMLLDKPLFDVGDPKGCIYDVETNTITAHDHFMGLWRDKFKTPEEYCEWYHGENQFEELHLHRRHIDLIKELNERGMICLTKDQN